jgi:dihydroflavonol-4-reductase
MRITVTGATGHIGNNLIAALLAQGHEVTATALRRESALDDLDLRFAAADLRDPAAVRRAVRGAERVYHCGALISLFEADAARMHAVNVGGVQHVLAACEAEGVARLVHFSSIHAFAARAEAIDERAPLSHAPHLPAYHRGKALATELVRAAAPRLDVVLVHPTSVIGPRDFLRGIVGRQLWLSARGLMKVAIHGGFDFVDVRDVVAGAIAAADRGRRGQSYLLTGHWRSLRELFGAAAALGGHGPPWFDLPVPPLRPVAALLDALAWVTPLRAGLSRASLHTIRNYRHISRALAEAELGYAPRPFEDTIADTIAWYREHSSSRPRRDDLEGRDMSGR